MNVTKATHLVTPSHVRLVLGEDRENDWLDVYRWNRQFGDDVSSIDGTKESEA